MPELARQVIRERSFERQLRELIEDAREAEDFVEGAEFVLARDPEAGLGFRRRNLVLADGSNPRSASRTLLHVRRFDGHAARYRERLNR